jgi:DNA adenine methylase
MYLDPPYPGHTRSGGKADHYAVEMTDGEHVELLELLLDCKANVMLSTYPNGLYEEKLTDWRKLEKSVKAQVANSGGERTEVLYLNF